MCAIYKATLILMDFYTSLFSHIHLYFQPSRLQNVLKSEINKCLDIYKKTEANLVKGVKKIVSIK